LYYIFFKNRRYRASEKNCEKRNTSFNTVS
jgi:hypothetical protein